MSLEVKDITFRYQKDDKLILDHFSAEFPDNEITAVTGKNGTGKTTLARIVTGILKPEQGDIIVDGTKINDYTLAERGRMIGYVMQNPQRQIFASTVEAEIRYGLVNLGLTEEEIQKRVDEYLSFFEIEQYRETFPFSLSFGEKQRLVLAAILAMKPQYLILDEPTASLDYKRKERLGQYLENINCGIIVISHDSGFVDKYCTRVVKMEKNYE